MIKVLIADDHPIVRRGLRDVLASEPDMRMVGEAQTGEEVLAMVERQNWDVVVMDISMPGRGGLDVMRELKQRHPQLPVLILSIYPEDQYAVRALRAGAAGYLTKGSPPEELVGAIRRVLSGRKYVGPVLAEILASQLEDDIQPPHEKLSDREYLVLCMIGSGKTVTQIAETLSLSVKTISTYRTRILQKMRLASNAELVSYAVHHGLVD